MMQPVTRFPDWRERLTAYVTKDALAPFVFGRHDCALFAAGAVLSMTGTDPAAPFRGRYRSYRGGLRVVRAAGYSDHVEVFARMLPACAVAEARPGDVAVIDTPDGAAVGVVQGAAVYVLAPSGALALVPLSSARGAFRV